MGSVEGRKAVEEVRPEEKILAPVSERMAEAWSMGVLVGDWVSRGVEIEGMGGWNVTRVLISERVQRRRRNR